MKYIRFICCAGQQNEVSIVLQFLYLGARQNIAESKYIKIEDLGI